MDEHNAMNEFIAYAEEKGVKRDAEGLKVSGKVINTQMKAYVARNIIGEEGFYPIIKQIDKTLLRAIEVSQQNLMVQNVVATDSVVSVLQ
jgi:carboxyl-terminal processing protease